MYFIIGQCLACGVFQFGGDLVLGVKIQKMSHKQAYPKPLLEIQM